MATSTIKRTLGIVESGTDGIWKYHKYGDGTYHAWYEGNVGITGGVALGGGYFHSTTTAFTPPTFSKSVTSLVGAPTGTILQTFMGTAVDYTLYFWNGTPNVNTGIPIRADMYGTY